MTLFDVRKALIHSELNPQERRDAKDTLKFLAQLIRQPTKINFGFIRIDLEQEIDSKMTAEDLTVFWDYVASLRSVKQRNGQTH